MSAMAQGWLVAQREMRERGRSRSFRISLLLMVAVVIAMVLLPDLIDTTDSPQDVGLTGTTSQVFEQSLPGPGDPGSTVRLRHYEDPAAGEAALRDGHIDALVVDLARLEWRDEADAELQALLTSAVQVATVHQRAVTAGMDPAAAARMLAPVPVENDTIGAVAGQDPDDGTTAALVTAVLLMSIVIYGNLVLTGVVEEKASRVVEVLLARIPARALLGGKVVGIGLLGFGQLAVTALAALVASTAVDRVDVPTVSAGVLTWVLVWFVLGFALYAMLFGALGSLASRTEDAQAAAGPVSYGLIAGYWASFIAIDVDPDGLWARLLSLFPGTAPLAMPGRIALGATAWWEPPLAVVLTLAALVGLVGFAGRVYQNAVLRTGAAVRLRDAWRSGPGDEPSAPRIAHGGDPTGVRPPPSRPVRLPLVLAALGVLAAGVVFVLSRDVVWSAIALLLTFVVVRRVVPHR